MDLAELRTRGRSAVRAPNTASVLPRREPRRKPRWLRPWIPVVAGMTAMVGIASAQEQGWHFSPLPGEGDRAAMGCSHGATPEKHTCLVVRCEDDFIVGVHIHTSRAGTDAGRWRIEFDKGDPAYDVTAVEDGSPYGARIEGDVEPILFGLKNLGLVYLDPQDGADVDQQIDLSGSLYVINQALYFCAPRVEPEGPSD